MIDLGLGGKRVVVVGAGHRPPRPGIGRATAMGFAAAGATVACLDLSAERAEAVAAEIRESGGTAEVVTGDMRDEAQVADALSRATELMGGIDVCVTVVGEATWGAADRFATTDWNWAIETNLAHVFFVFREAARLLREQGSGGALAAVASVDGIAGAPLHVAYGCAKAGVIHLVKTLSEELGPDGIRVNAVAPGHVFTPTPAVPTPEYGADPPTPLRQPTATDIANALVFFCSDMAGAVSGQTLAVDGGAMAKGLWDFPPGMLERMASG
jgi:NAD(P)-dependent dehydrogenase (short-subunit alcohol dehydrogenase family)